MTDRRNHAIFIARKLLSESVFNMSSHEGNPFTFVEVKTLLDGVTVGGRRLSDQDQILRISNAWEYLINSVAHEIFSLTKEFTLNLHGILAKNEVLKWGKFRDGPVTIAGTDYQPPSAEILSDKFEQMVRKADSIIDVREKAIEVFLDCARAQFFFDGNKRTGQLLMNGLLMSDAQSIISIPARSALKYHTKMLRFYDSGYETVMRDFLVNCQDRLRASLQEKPEQDSSLTR